MMIPLSILIPVKNDAKNLAECLPLLTDFDDVTIVDSQSTDETAEIAAKWSRPVVQFHWNGQFPKKRNWALRNLTLKHPWVLFLDADERMTPAWRQEMFEFLNSECLNKNVAVVSCVYDNWFAGRLLKHGDVMRKTAVVRVGAAEYEKIDEDHWSDLDMEVHEHLQIKGGEVEKWSGGKVRADSRVYEIKARMEHHDMRSLESHWQKHVQYAEWEAGRYRQLMAHLERWETLTPRQKTKYRNLTKSWFAPAYFLVSYFLRRGFLDGLAGLRFAWFKLRYFRLVREKILAVRG